MVLHAFANFKSFHLSMHFVQLKLNFTGNCQVRWSSGQHAGFEIGEFQVRIPAKTLETNYGPTHNTVDKGAPSVSD
jgi:hypothetical protein